MNKAAEIFLSSLGLKITPAEIESAWENSKNALPQLAQTFATMKDEQTQMSLEIAALRQQQTELLEKVSTLLGLQILPMTQGAKQEEPMLPDSPLWTPEVQQRLLNGVEHAG